MLMKDEGVLVVYDFVGVDIFVRLMDCLVFKGILVSFGNVFGVFVVIDLGVFGNKGLFFFMCFSLFYYIIMIEEFCYCVDEFFKVVCDGILMILIN